MRWSEDKVGIIRASMIKEEDFLSYVFPILRYHSRTYADKYGLSYYNFLEHKEQIDIDYQTDTYGGGLYLNLAGATKLLKCFTAVMKKTVQPGFSPVAKSSFL